MRALSGLVALRDERQRLNLTRFWKESDGLGDSESKKQFVQDLDDELTSLVLEFTIVAVIYKVIPMVKALIFYQYEVEVPLNSMRHNLR